MSQTIGIISIKGGVGKTTTASNLGAVLAQQFQKKVLLIDANFSGADLGLHFGILKKQHTINGVLKNKYPIEKTIIKQADNLDIIPAALIYTKINPLLLAEKIKTIKEQYDRVILDGSPNLDDEILSTIHAADQLLIVTSADHTALSCTLHAIRIAQKKQTPILGLVLNRIKNKSFELTIEELEQAAKLPVLAVLPENTIVGEALSQTIPISLYAPDTEIAHEYKKLAGMLVKEKYKDPRIKKNIASKMGMIPKQEVNRMLIINSK